MALMGLVGCAHEETTRTVGNPQQRPIAFGSTYTAEPTRSSAAFTADKSIPSGESIGVYAYLHNTDVRNYADDIPNFMFNQQATCREDGEIFEYSPVKYWPNDDNSKLSFIAYFPYCNAAADDDTKYDTETTGITLTKDNTDEGLPTFGFTVNDDAEKQVDFLVSGVIANLPKTRDTEGDPGQPFNDLSITDRVSFFMEHATAKVEFRIVADADIYKDIVNFKLNSLSISNLYKDGTLTPAYAPATGITSYTWSGHSAKHGADPTYLQPFKTYEPQLLMPQTLSDEVKMSVSYQITFKSDGTTYHYEGGVPVSDQDYTYENEAEVQLNEMLRTGTNTPVTEWLPNNHYIYTIRLRAKRIEFTGEVVDWGEYIESEEIEVIE